MKTVPIPRSRRNRVAPLAVVQSSGAPLVTRGSRSGARVLPFPGATAQLEPAGALLKDRMEFAGDGSSPREASWSSLR